MWNRRSTGVEWTAGSARVDGNLESDHPTWVLTAVRGRRQRIDIAGGPMVTRPVAEGIARAMNDLDPSWWDLFIVRRLPEMLAGEWG